MDQCVSSTRRRLHYSSPSEEVLRLRKALAIRHGDDKNTGAKTPGGFTRPKNPPSVWPNVPRSCLPTPKPPPRRRRRNCYFSRVSFNSSVKNHSLCQTSALQLSRIHVAAMNSYGKFLFFRANERCSQWFHRQV